MVLLLRFTVMLRLIIDNTSFLTFKIITKSQKGRRARWWPNVPSPRILDCRFLLPSRRFSYRTTPRPSKKTKTDNTDTWCPRVLRHHQVSPIASEMFLITRGSGPEAHTAAFTVLSWKQLLDVFLSPSPTPF